MKPVGEVTAILKDTGTDEKLATNEKGFILPHTKPGRQPAVS